MRSNGPLHQVGLYTPLQTPRKTCQYLSGPEILEVRNYLPQYITLVIMLLCSHSLTFRLLLWHIAFYIKFNYYLIPLIIGRVTHPLTSLSVIILIVFIIIDTASISATYGRQRYDAFSDVVMWKFLSPWVKLGSNMENLSYASTCQTIGLHTSYFASSTVFPAFNSEAFVYVLASCEPQLPPLISDTVRNGGYHYSH